MAAPGFGFSAGDFIAAIDVTIKVTKALRDAGGAADEYRSVVQELTLLRSVLDQVQDGGRTGPFKDFAKAQADITLSTLSEFLGTISKFDAALGQQAGSGWYRGAGKKARWALKYAKEVEKLRARVGTQLQVLNALLTLELSQ